MSRVSSFFHAFMPHRRRPETCAFSGAAADASAGASSFVDRILSWLVGAGAQGAEAEGASATLAIAAQAAAAELQQQLQAEAYDVHDVQSSAAQTAVRTAQARRAQQAEELAEQQEGVRELCRCLGMHMPPYAEAQTAPLRYFYIKARLALCQFTCAHRDAISATLSAEVAICLIVAAALLVRRGAAALAAARSSAAAPGAAATGRGATCAAAGGQFVVCAADDEWKQPLLQSQV